MDSLEEEMATHSSILAGKIPCTEDPGGLQPGGVHGGRRESDSTEQVSTRVDRQRWVVQLRPIRRRWGK